MSPEKNGRELRRVNRNRIFRLVHRHERISQQEIARQLGLSLPTVAQNLKALQEEGLVAENGAFASTGGRRARGISCIRDARLAVGLDITRSHISAVLTDLGGAIVNSLRVSVPFRYEEGYFRRLGQAAAQVAAGVEPSRLLGAGVSVPGIVSADGAHIPNSHVLGFRGGESRDFTRFLPCPGSLCNDASAAGKAELWGLEGVQNMVYLSLSNSVGGAILLGGRLYEGENRRAGEFGHMTLFPGGRPCYCGKRGCLDAYCSAERLSAPYGGELPAFFRALEQGETAAAALWQEYLESLAAAVNSLRMAFDCTVILGGYVGAYLEPYMGELRRLAAGRSTFEDSAAYLQPCRYKREAAAVGASLLYIEPFMESI